MCAGMRTRKHVSQRVKSECLVPIISVVTALQKVQERNNLGKVELPRVSVSGWPPDSFSSDS